MTNIHDDAGLKPTSFITEADMKKAYYGWRDFEDKLIPVKSGTSGHRGVTGIGFSEKHVRSIIQAAIDLRRTNGTFGPALCPQLAKPLEGKPLGPIVLGKDARYASNFAHKDAVEVIAGNDMTVIVHKGERETPTPVISWEILRRNRKGENVEGVIITASHNPPEEAGIKTNGRDGGPNTLTKPLDNKANYYMKKEYSEIKSIPLEKAKEKGLVIEADMVTPYVEDLKNVVKIDIIKGSSLAFGVTPLGGSAHGYYQAVNATYGTKIRTFLADCDPSGSCRTMDWDGKLRGDPSSKYVMMAVKGIRENNGLAAIFANDNDSDRFGGEDPSGTLNPNHVLCVLFNYLATERGFNSDMGIGRTIGSTHMLDKIAKSLNRPFYETNVGFKHYVEGLINGKYVLAGEESAGLSLPRLDGSLWVTEKDGIAANLLMMEVIAKTGKDIGALYKELESKFGKYNYERIDSPATDEKKSRLAALAGNPKEVEGLLFGKKIAGRSIERMKVGDGVKIVLENDVWVLFRASGTENIIKVYREERGDSLKTAVKATEELQSLLKL
jgi:phosphoglucomutase